MNIEKLATSAVVESISKTDVLDPFVNDGDKEPSWDGNIVSICSNKATPSQYSDKGERNCRK